MSQFSLNIAEFAKLAGKRMDAVVHKTVLDIGTRIVERSPVRTGRFRANWQYGNVAYGIPIGTIDDVDLTGAKAIAGIVRGLGTIEGTAGMIHYLRNNLPYAIPLENGWSKQAPAGMVGITVVEFQGIVSEAVAESKGKT